MIRNGDLTARTARMADRIREIGALLPTDRVRREQEGDPLGLGLTYPVMFMAYDIERDIEVPLSGLIHEDDPNLVVVSLVAEAIAEETARGLWTCDVCGSVTANLADPFGIGGTICLAAPRERTEHHWNEAPASEIVYVMEVWS